jgi:hypothetical protein
VNRRAKRGGRGESPYDQARASPGEAGREAGAEVRQDFCREVLA